MLVKVQQKPKSLLRQPQKGQPAGLAAWKLRTTS